MIRAVVSDFNGVIADDEALHFEAFRRTLAPLGLLLSREDYYGRYFGFDDRECLAACLRDGGQPGNESLVRRLVEEKSAHYWTQLGGGVPLFPGAERMLERISAVFPVAINSGARRREIEHILGVGHLARFVRAVVSADEVARGKPHPEGYLAALDRLRETVGDLGPGECLVVEDSPQGIEAGKAAGMRCVAVTHSRPRGELGGADAVVDALDEIDAELAGRL